jgi:hypothetical protein
MFKKFSLALVLVIVVFLSGCTLPWNKPITEIVYQEDKTVNSLQDFLSEAQIIADKQIGNGAQLKIIYYSYFNNVFSYEATFAKDGESLKNGVLKNIVISYNKAWEVKKESSISSHVSKEEVNNKIIAIECNDSKMCAGNLASTMADPKNDIDISNIKISLNTFTDDKYLTGSNLGFIKNNNGVPIGNFGKFRFNAVTGTIVDGTSVDISKWYEEQTGSPLNVTDTAEISSEVISTSTADVLAQNFNNDSDNDGLTNLQEAGYGTNPNKVDTDSDGNSDSQEINNGYNPLGSGKLISDDCVKNPETDKCYLEIAKAKKDISFCKKISTKEDIFKCIFTVNLITKNPQICEELNSAPENDVPDFYNTCLKELVGIVNPTPTYNYNGDTSADRDAHTINDVKQIQTGLELYYNDNNSYPSTLEVLTIGTSRFISSLPLAIEGKSDICSKDYNYKYIFINDKEYSLTYCIDESSGDIKNAGITPGVNTATQNGLGKNASIVVESAPIIVKSSVSSNGKPLEYSSEDRNILRIMYWSGKVNQHWDLGKGLWVTDPDGISGSGEDKLTYCKKFYPSTISVVEYKKETIDTWSAGGASSGYKNTVMSYRCVLKN